MFKDLFNIEKYFPKRIKLYINEEQGIDAGEVINPPNPYVPEVVRWFDDDKRGIHVLDWGADKEKVKKIEWQDLSQKNKKLDY